jgi:nucleoside-diphosphate-sugar epimerase
VGTSVRALVTGGAGFIGSNVVDLFLDRDHEVTILDDVSSGYADNCAPQARYVQGDVRDPETVASAIQGCDVVCHLAAPLSEWWTRPSRSSWRRQRAISRASRARSVRRWLAICQPQMKRL